MLIHRTQVCLPIKQRSYPIPTPIAPSIELSQEQQAELEKKVRRHKSEQRIALRSHIILLAATGLTSQAIAEKLGISDESVSKWRRRCFCAIFWFYGYTHSRRKPKENEYDVHDLWG